MNRHILSLSCLSRTNAKGNAEEIDSIGIGSWRACDMCVCVFHAAVHVAHS